jgi:hypothetical protein
MKNSSFVERVVLLFLGLSIIISCTKLDLDTKVKVGQFYQGGKVFYLFKEGDSSFVPGETHGIIVTSQDLIQNASLFPNLSTQYSNLLRWSTEGRACSDPNVICIMIAYLYYFANGAYNTEVGYAKYNTDKINLAFKASANLKYAAGVCDTLTLNGYNDWYLPTERELHLLSQVNDKLSLGFDPTIPYWSSTESSSSNYLAYSQTFNHGKDSSKIIDKGTIGKVRAIRYF